MFYTECWVAFPLLSRHVSWNRENPYFIGDYVLYDTKRKISLIYWCYKVVFWELQELLGRIPFSFLSKKNLYRQRNIVPTRSNLSSIIFMNSFVNFYLLTWRTDTKTLKIIHFLQKSICNFFLRLKYIIGVIITLTFNAKFSETEFNKNVRKW